MTAISTRELRATRWGLHRRPQAGHQASPWPLQPERTVQMGPRPRASEGPQRAGVGLLSASRWFWVLGTRAVRWRVCVYKHRMRGSLQRYFSSRSKITLGRP